MTDKKVKPETKELSDTDLDKVQGAGWEDGVAAIKSKSKSVSGTPGFGAGPQPKNMERVHEDE